MFALEMGRTRKRKEDAASLPVRRVSVMRFGSRVLLSGSSVASAGAFV